MDKFIIAIQEIYTEINTQNTSLLFIKPSITQKQYLIYYIYRIICKFYNLINSIGLNKNINEIKQNLQIPQNFKYVCYPLSGKMIRNEQQLDLTFNNMITLFEEILNYLTENINSLNDKMFNFFSYFDNKTKKQIIIDIQELTKYLPNLSSYTYK